MAGTLTINWANDTKYARDIDAVAQAWGYDSELVLDPSLTKKNFIEKRIKDQIANASKQARHQIAVNEIVVDE